MTTRRSFLGTLGMAGGAILCGEAILEEFARLTHVRKSFPSAGIPQRWGGRVVDYDEWVLTVPDNSRTYTHLLVGSREIPFFTVAIDPKIPLGSLSVGWRNTSLGIPLTTPTEITIVQSMLTEP